MTKKKLSTQKPRQRVQKQKSKKLPEPNIRPLDRMEAQNVQYLFQINQQYGKLTQQYEEYKLIVRQLTERRKDVQQGKIELPILLPLSRNKFYQCSNKKVILKELDEEIEVMTDAMRGVEGQVKNNRDALISAGLSVLAWSKKRFEQYKPENVYSKGCSPTKDEKVLFEAELDDIEKNPKAQKELEEALEVAKKENKK
jgi:hypothetical protein